VEDCCVAGIAQSQCSQRKRFEIKLMPQAAAEVVRQPRISCGKPDDIRSARRKLQALKNVVDADTHSANAGMPATFSGFDCDAIKQVGFMDWPPLSV